MLAKKTRPIIGKIAGSPCSGNRIWFSDTVTSPTSPLEYKIQSPRGLKSYDLGGIGLGIVVALEKSGNYSGPGTQIHSNKAVFVHNLTLSSNPIHVKPTNNTKGCDRYGEDLEENEMGSLEDYTFVTCHGSNKSYTRVYCDNNGADHGRVGHEYDRRSTKNCGFPVFDISPARFGEDHFTAYPTSDFLNSCNLCHKKLHGKDIYMYRGDVGFCSRECRYRQMVMDERQEKCSSDASISSTDVSNSPYTNGQIYSTGILAV